MPTRSGSTMLTLRAGYSLTGSRFTAPATAGTPRRLCPSHVMFFAAFASLSRISPQLVQTCVRMERLFFTISPPPEHACEVYAGGTATTHLPAHSALQVRIWPKLDHPAS